MLPFRQAIFIPIFVYGKINFRGMRGSIIINEKIYTGMIVIGYKYSYTKTSVPLSVWTINGKIIFNGRIRFLNGTYVLVTDNAELLFGTNGTIIGSDTKIMCFEKIHIGNTVRITWECQIMDTGFHYVKDINNDNTGRLTKPIVIGNNVWIANRTTIMKGSIIPDWTIVASNSLVNKDFSNIGNFCMLAGQPAKVKSTNIQRIFDAEEQRELDNIYHYERTHL